MPDPADADRPTPLEYRDPKLDASNASDVSAGPIALGLFGFGTIFWLSMFAALEQGASEGRPLFFLIPAGTVLVCLALVLYLKRRGSPEYSAGLLIGIGLAILLEGMCFGVLLTA